MFLVSVMVLACGSVAAGIPPAMPPDKALATELHQLAGDGFRIKETDHFTIAYDTEYETLRSMVGRLEGSFDAVWNLCTAHGLKVNPPESRLGILFFQKFEPYAAHCKIAEVDPAIAAGFYHQRLNRSAFVNTLSMPDVARMTAELDDARKRADKLAAKRATVDEANAIRAQVASLEGQRDAFAKRFNQFILQHEAAHHVLFNIGVHVRGGDNPGWLVEGLACQFEVPQPQASQRRISVNHYRLQDFRLALELSVDAKDVATERVVAAIRNGKLIPLRDFLRRDTLQEDAGDKLNYRYSQAWALVHYLLREHREGFGRYVGELARREHGQRVESDRELLDFESVFGPVDAAFEKRWIESIAKLRFEPEQAK